MSLPFCVSISAPESAPALRHCFCSFALPSCPGTRAGVASVSSDLTGIVISLGS
jgi:hypothetical protein